MSRITPFFGPILCRESRCIGDTFQPYKKWWVTQNFFYQVWLTVLWYLCRVGVLVLLSIVICCQVVSMVTLFLSHSQTSLASYGAVVYRSQCRDGMGSSCSAIYAMKTTETELPRSTPTMPVGHEAECEDFFGR